MADKSGYIGRSPSDSSVTISRQTNTTTGAQSTFVFNSGYDVGYMDVYLNGSKLINAIDYTATDGQNVVLTTASTAGDVLEFVAYKAFNITQPINSATSLIVSEDLSVGGDLSVTGSISGEGSAITGIVTSLTAGSNISLSGSTGNVTIAGLANTANIKSDTIDSGSLNVTGLSTFRNTVLLNGDTKLNFFSSTSQEGQIFATSEYLYINSSADNGVFVQTNGFIELKRGSGSDKYIEMNSHPNHNGEVSLYYDGNKKLETTNTGITVTGTVGATAFTGDGSQLSGVVSGIELQQAGSSVGTSLTAINFQSGATLTPGSGGISTITIAAAITTSVLTPSANTVVTLDLSAAQHHDLTLTAGITTITCSGGVFGESHAVVITQPSSGIATVGFSTFFLFPSGSAPSMSQGNDKIDLLSFVVKRVGAAGTQLLASAGLNYQ